MRNEHGKSLGTCWKSEGKVGEGDDDMKRCCLRWQFADELDLDGNVKELEM